VAVVVTDDGGNATTMKKQLSGGMELAVTSARI